MDMTTAYELRNLMRRSTKDRIRIVQDYYRFQSLLQRLGAGIDPIHRVLKPSKYHQSLRSDWNGCRSSSIWSQRYHIDPGELSSR
ncbi:hypothetical protein BLNAU_23293 [Blattamonas nauphoetae]|uniref:Uncharacterized protein n=1 Tax=Blattamonas nauphoetae TaxID=2049346 RepID=A0ABQ9WQM3_9EUKA|nr:hypothetical protein BLNAU_23293 [Blattamonas nauphoetae]